LVNEKRKSKQVIDGLAANSFRVVAVGQDIILESFYIYPDFSSLSEGQTLEFNTDPEGDDEPNIRVIMSREVAARLANALVGTLGNVQRAAGGDEPQMAGAGASAQQA
jgi:hypothetical protein